VTEKCDTGVIRTGYAYLSTMIIVNQDGGRSPLKRDDTQTPATAPPPYAPTAPPNHIPSYQAIPQTPHVILPRPSPMRRFLLAFAVAILVLLLWGAFLDSFDKAARHFPPNGRRHYEFVCFTIHSFLYTPATN
jgi:hypothetical protein